MKYYIAGIHKCGTTSIQKLLESQGHKVVRHESSFWDRPPYQMSDHKLVFILRDPVKRTWSHYNYKRYHQEGDRQQIRVSFEEALFLHPELLLHSYYDYWINLWKPDEIIWLEEMIEKYGDVMPQLTKSVYHEELTDDRINLIKSGLEALKNNKLKFSYLNTWTPNNGT